MNIDIINSQNVTIKKALTELGRLHRIVNKLDGETQVSDIVNISLDSCLEITYMDMDFRNLHQEIISGLSKRISSIESEIKKAAKSMIEEFQEE